LINETHRLGIVVPVPEQKDWVRERYSHITSLITVTDASPYGDTNRFSQTSKILKEADCDLIVMYCMGFTRELTKEIRTKTEKPVIVSSSIVARTIGELLE
jgi:protein AroM